MKNLYLFTLLILTTFTVYSQTSSVAWDSPIDVASGSTYSNVFPRINLVTGDKPIITWSKASNAKIYSAVWSGTSFLTPVNINPAGVTPFIQNWSGPEAASSGNSVFVTFSTEPAMSGKIYTVRSTDGGITFQDTVRVDNVGTDKVRFPSVAVGSGNNPIVNFMRFDSGFGNAEYAVARSMNGGTSYMPDVNVSALAQGNVCDCCPGAITTSGNRHISMYRNNKNNIRTMYASMSTDGSATYTQATEIDLTNWMIMSCPSSGPSGVIVGDSLIYTWMSEASGEARVYIGTMNINDQQIGVNKQIFPVAIGSQNYPVIAAKGDTVSVVWQGNPISANDVYFSYSTTGASGIGNIVDTLTAGGMGDQTRPDIEFNNGKFHISYSDNMGTVVKYLKGTLTTTSSIKEKNIGSEFSLSSYYANEKIELIVKSEKDLDAMVEIVNSLGQKITKQALQINSGQNTYVIPYDNTSGSYYLILTTEEGKTYQEKILIVK